MIYKSYLVEENLSSLKNNISLFYGENIGLINQFKKKLSKYYNEHKIIHLSDDQIILDQQKFFNEVQNISLFEDKKIYFINITSEKILQVIEETLKIIDQNKIYLFGTVLEKKSKIRNYFEKNPKLNIIPCYKDNDIGIKKIIISSLKNFSGVSPQVINIIKENSDNDRLKLNNEIEKIKTYFVDKTINTDDLLKLLNIKSDGEFDLIKNAALSGEKIKTNQLISSTLIDPDKSIYYISNINQRLLKLKEIYLLDSKNINQAINNLKPPIFWKDKPFFLSQAKLWNEKKINSALDKTYSLEIKIKSNSMLEKKFLIKNLLIDICNLANAS